MGKSLETSSLETARNHADPSYKDGLIPFFGPLHSRAMNSADLTNLEARVLASIASLRHPDTKDSLFNQSAFAEDIGSTSASISRACTGLLEKGYIRAVRRVSISNGWWVNAYRVCGVEDLFDKWELEKTAKHHQVDFFDKNEAIPESCSRQATKTVAAKQPAMRSSAGYTAQGKHGYTAQGKQRETIPKRYNSPPTPSETHASKPELPREEEFEFLWNCLAGHHDFPNWKRTRHFKALLQPILDEHGLVSGLELLQNVLTAAAQCSYWGRKTTQSLVWFSDWHRWLPAVLKPTNFERLAAEGAALFERKIRREKVRRAQKKADADQELVRQEVQADDVDRMQEYRNMLEKAKAKAKAKNLKEKAATAKRSASFKEQENTRSVGYMAEAMAENKAKRLQESKANKAAMDELAGLASPKATQACPAELQNELDESPKQLKDKEESRAPAKESPEDCLLKPVCHEVVCENDDKQPAPKRRRRAKSTWPQPTTPAKRDNPIAEARAALARMNSPEQDTLQSSTKHAEVYSDQKPCTGSSVPIRSLEPVSDGRLTSSGGKPTDCAGKPVSNGEGFHNTHYRATAPP